MKSLALMCLHGAALSQHAMPVPTPVPIPITVPMPVPMPIPMAFPVPVPVPAWKSFSASMEELPVPIPVPVPVVGKQRGTQASSPQIKSIQVGASFQARNHPGVMKLHSTSYDWSLVLMREDALGNPIYASEDGLFELTVDTEVEPSPSPPVVPSPFTPPVPDGKHPGAIMVKSQFSEIGGIVELEGEDSDGYPIYASQDKQMYFCHVEAWPGWSLRSGSCHGDFRWTSNSQETELADVNPIEGQEGMTVHTIDSFEVAPVIEGCDEGCDPKYSGDLFTDSEFPPNDDSLGADWLQGAERPELLGSGKVQWIRALDINRDAPEDLFDRMHFSDIRQGGIGDCWLIAALSTAVAQHKDFIKDLFQEKVVSSNGKYTVKLWDIRINAFVDVTVDDWIPCLQRSKYDRRAKTLFSENLNHEVWPLILEKAFAKFLGPAGGWNKLVAGMEVWAWQAMGICTDMSNVFLNIWQAFHNDLEKQREGIFKDPVNGRRNIDGLIIPEQLSADTFWTRMLNLGVSFLADGNTQEGSNERGVPGSHAYSILSAMELQAATGERLRLMRLRNAWGNEVKFTGDWGKDSPKWDEHPEVQQEITRRIGDDQHTADNGVFWMTYEDFQEIYFSVEVCNFLADERSRDEL